MTAANPRLVPEAELQAYVDGRLPAEGCASVEAAMLRVLPDAKIERLPITHPIFNTFFKIKTLAVPYPGPLGEHAKTRSDEGCVEQRRTGQAH